MKLILFGATGMVGAGVLRQALADPQVEKVLAISRGACGVQHEKLRELLMPDLFDLAAAPEDLAGWDACIWGLGISTVGLGEAAYAEVTEELTLLWARALLAKNPNLSFCYCSAAGADGSAMWARVRQRVECELQTMPFRHVGAVRPAYIQPGPGIKSKVKLYQAFIVMVKPVSGLLVSLLPSMATTSERLGRAMLRVVQGRADRFILESADINRIGA
ncbi:MAG: hypothetical protein O2795_19490 [Acidobacteria bacterium]|nr:hypothetical protein [Acidobacteriota bacterium]